MPIKDKTTLKSMFATGMTPTGEDFSDLIDTLEIDTLDARYLGVKGDGSNETSLIQSAIDSLPSGTNLKFPIGTYSFDSIIVTKPVTLDFQNSTITSASINKDIITIRGNQENNILVLTQPAKRHDKKIFVSDVFNISPRDLIQLRDDTVRATDGNVDMNLETHEVIGVDPIAKSITLRDYVRLPKSVATNNGFKLLPLENVVIKNATLKMKEGSTGGRCIFAEKSKWVKFENINTDRSAGSSIQVTRSYGVSIDGFKMTSAQVVGSGQGYGFQLFAGVNNVTIKNGYVEGLRHAIDMNSAFDVNVENVLATNCTSSAFSLSHNGWTADITVRDCRAIDAYNYGFQLSSQGVSDPYSIAHYGIRIINCEAQMRFDEAVSTYAVMFDTPVKESLISGFKAWYGDGTVIGNYSGNAGLSFSPVYNDLVVENIEVTGFKEGLSFYKGSTSLVESNPSDITRIRNVKSVNMKDVIVSSYGASKKMTIDNVVADNITSSVFRFAGTGGFRFLEIKNVKVSRMQSGAKLFLVNPAQDANGLYGSLENVKSDTSVKTEFALTAGYNMTIDDIFFKEKNGILFVSTGSAVTVGTTFLPTSLFEGMSIRLFNTNATDAITIPVQSTIVTKSGASRVLNPKDSVLFHYSNGKWYEI